MLPPGGLQDRLTGEIVRVNRAAGGVGVDVALDFAQMQAAAGGGDVHVALAAGDA